MKRVSLILIFVLLSSCQTVILRRVEEYKNGDKITLDYTKEGVPNWSSNKDFNLNIMKTL